MENAGSRWHESGQVLVLLKNTYRHNTTQTGNGTGLLNKCAEPDLERSELGQSDKEIRKVYRENYRELIRYACRRVGSFEAAQDVVQQAFTNTLTEIERGAHIRNMAAFLQSCVHNICANSLRRDPMQLINDELCRSTGNSTEASVELREKWREVTTAVNGLGSNQRCAFVMAEFNGLECREIAGKMNCTTETVWQLLSRARRQIRETV